MPYEEIIPNIQESFGIFTLLNREVFNGDDTILFVAAFPLDISFRFEVIDSNNNSVWPFNELNDVSYNFKNDYFDKGYASVYAGNLDPGDYTILLYNNNTKIEKKITILDSKCCKPLKVSTQQDVFIPGDWF